VTDTVDKVPDLSGAAVWKGDVFDRTRQLNSANGMATVHGERLEMFGQCFEILHSGCEMELVTCSGESP
jgi:hypothetical protein